MQPRSAKKRGNGVKASYTDFTIHMSHLSTVATTDSLPGNASVALATLATALFVLQMHDRLANLAVPEIDGLGRELDEQRLLAKRIWRPLNDRRAERFPFGDSE